MAEITRAFAVGDSVISTSCLIAPPMEAPGVTLEISVASRGTVVDVRPYAYPKPYVVVFEVGEGGTVEIDVMEEQIGRVYSHEPIAVPILDPIDMPPLITRRGVSMPSPSHPHRRCRALHKVNFLLMCGVYGSVLERYPLWTLGLTLTVLVCLYSAHLRSTGMWSWIPEILWHDEPSVNERVAVSPKHVTYAFHADVLFGLSAALVLVNHTVNLTSTSPVLSIACSGVAFMAWVTKAATHERAARIVPL